MLFHLHNDSLMSKYPSIQYQKLHEYEYRKFLKTLQTTYPRSINVSKENSLKNRQLSLQYRQDKRKVEYERIQRENWKFSEKLIHAKAFLNRYEQQVFFDKHCKLKQRLQRYPNALQSTAKQAHLPFSLENPFKANHQSIDSVFLIDNGSGASHQSSKSREKRLKTSYRIPISTDLSLNADKSERKLSSLTKHQARFLKPLPPITTTIHKTISK